jgi:ribosome maturation factor RimP
LKKESKSQLLDEVESIVNNLGFSVVEVNSSTSKNRLKINLIIHKEEGVKIEDCSVVHKTVFPRLEIIYDNFDVYLEVSSPGIERAFKDAREFSIFTGRAVKVMHSGMTDWEQGLIESTENDEVTVVINDVAKKLKFSDIHKCKLDYLREVQKS